MKKHTALLLCAILLAVAAGTPAVYTAERRAPDTRQCREMLHALYAAIPALSGESVWKMRYTVSVTGRDDGATRRYQAEILLGTTAMKLVSSELEMYQDETTSVTVVPAEKRIYLADRRADDGAGTWMQTFLALRDSILFNACDVQECREVRGNDGATLRRLTLVFKPELRERLRRRYPIESIVIVFNPASNRLHSYTTNFSDSYALKSIELLFHEIDYQYSRENLPARAGDKYLTEGRKLRPAYKSYTVIDVRTKR